MATLLDLLFGCSHSNYTFPITLRRGRSGASPRTYVVCLDCGKEFAYVWKEMRMVAPREDNAAALRKPAESYAVK